MFGRRDVDFGQETKMSISKVYTDDKYHNLIVIGTVDKTNVPYTGVVDFPRRPYPFWYYPDERTIYWSYDKGTDIWKYGKCFPGLLNYTICCVVAREQGASITIALEQGCSVQLKNIAIKNILSYPEILKYGTFQIQGSAFPL